MKTGTDGFSAAGLIITLAAIALLSGTGYYVYKQRGNDKAVNTPAAAKAKDEAPKIPEGWVEYTHSTYGLNFYHPKGWDAAKIKIEQYGQYEAIPTGYGNAISVVFEKDAAKWAMYEYYGTAHQAPAGIQPGDEFGLATARAPIISEYPVAYRQVAHAAVATHDIYLVRDAKAYRIRLPEINSFESANWEDLLAEQAAAIPTIIKTLHPNH